MKEIRLNVPRLQSIINKIGATKIVALGNTAKTALTLLRANHYAMPHPSGMNRKLNNAEFIEEKIKGLQDYLQSPDVLNL